MRTRGNKLPSHRIQGAEWAAFAPDARIPNHRAHGAINATALGRRLEEAMTDDTADGRTRPYEFGDLEGQPTVPLEQAASRPQADGPRRHVAEAPTEAYPRIEEYLEPEAHRPPANPAPAPAPAFGAPSEMHGAYPAPLGGQPPVGAQSAVGGGQQHHPDSAGGGMRAAMGPIALVTGLLCLAAAIFAIVEIVTTGTQSLVLPFVIGAASVPLLFGVLGFVFPEGRRLRWTAILGIILAFLAPGSAVAANVATPRPQQDGHVEAPAPSATATPEPTATETPEPTATTPPRHTSGPRSSAPPRSTSPGTTGSPIWPRSTTETNHAVHVDVRVETTEGGTVSGTVRGTNGMSGAARQSDEQKFSREDAPFDLHPVFVIGPGASPRLSVTGTADRRGDSVTCTIEVDGRVVAQDGPSRTVSCSTTEIQ